MADEKVKISELIRLHRSIEPREFALAEFYPQTHSGTAAHLKRPGDSVPDNSNESVAKPWKKPWDK
jgi:hypothetical protein